MQDIITWIEAHPTTVELVQLATLLAVGWFSGFFRFVRNAARKPSVQLGVGSSRCYIEEFDELDGRKDVVRAAFLLDVLVRNPTTQKIVVESFSMSYSQKGWLFARSKEFHPISLPDRPRQQMGSGTKVMKVFFTSFDDGLEQLTMSGEIEQKQVQSGYVFFVSFTFGSWNPRLEEQAVRARICCHLTTGERIRGTAKVQVVKDAQQFEEWVPGIIKQITHQSSWNALRE